MIQRPLPNPSSAIDIPFPQIMHCLLVNDIIVEVEFASFHSMGTLFVEVGAYHKDSLYTFY